jgi:Predicted ATPase
MHIDTEGLLHLTREQLAAESIAVLGRRGSGKSMTAGVLVEEMLAAGIPMTLIDIESEMWGLRERYPLLVVGRSQHADVDVAVENAGKLAAWVWENNASVILDFGTFEADGIQKTDYDEIREFLLNYLQVLWAKADRDRRAHMLLLEEAQEFIPQGGVSPLKNLLIRYAKRGRKRGLGMVVVSQRSAAVDKDVLSQAGVLFLHRVTHPTDIKVYADLLSRSTREVGPMIRPLQPGQAVVMYNDEPRVVQIRQRHTFHGGATPDGSMALPTLKTFDKQVLNSLRAAFASAAPLETVTALQAEVTRLQAVVAERDTKIAQLEKERAKAQQQPVAQAKVEARQDVVVREKVTTTTTEREFRSSRAVQLAVKRQQQGFERLLREVQGLTLRERSALGYLMGSEGKQITRRELARRIDYSEARMSGALTTFARMGFTQSLGKGLYVVGVAAFLKAEFPDLVVDDLLERLEEVAV